MIPTTIRIHVVSPPAAQAFCGMVTTTLGGGKLEARFHVYLLGENGCTALVRDEFWSTEAGAITQWEEWRKDVLALHATAAHSGRLS